MLGKTFYVDIDNRSNFFGGVFEKLLFDIWEFVFQKVITICISFPHFYIILFFQLQTSSGPMTIHPAATAFFQPTSGTSFQAATGAPVFHSATTFIPNSVNFYFICINICIYTFFFAFIFYSK